MDKQCSTVVLRVHPRCTLERGTNGHFFQAFIECDVLNPKKFIMFE